MSFAKEMSENIGKNKSKSLSGKYSQTLFDHRKHSATDALETGSKRVIQKKQLIYYKNLRNITTE